MFKNLRSNEPASTPAPVVTPPLDALLPAKLETATFAVG